MTTSYDLKRALDDACDTAQAPWVRRISAGKRRWWIGSFLEYVDRSPQLGPQERGILHSIFAKLLRGCDCGARLRCAPIVDTPMLGTTSALDDPDLRVGLWSAEDVSFVLLVLDVVVAVEQPSFRAPAGRVGIAPSTDDDWNTLVWEALDELRAIRHFPSERPWIISFIG
jgi:hypothetical protein